MRPRGDACGESRAPPAGSRRQNSRREPGQEVKHELGKGRAAWLQIARGGIELNGQKLNQGDGAAVTDESKLTLKGVDNAEVLLFDLA